MSEIITFYSYKGGVGRTMALANASVLLSKWGHKVLVVDWDLEAPGLEHFYKDFIDIKSVETTPGVIDFLQLNESVKWQDGIIPVTIPRSDVPVHFISSGKRDEDYFKKVREFDVEKYYEEHSGGDIIEQLRNEWLAAYDYILIDSRTGITEIGGICTIQLPDTVVMLFTATNQGFEGALDIIKRAGAAQQKLPYDRQKLIFLPIPSKFDATPEFKLSQEWLGIFAGKLESTYNDWLPASIDRKEFLELTKIPYLPYFSFGEKLPVIEQGVTDPAGLGYAYESLAALIANNLTNVDRLYSSRDQYIAAVNKHYVYEPESKKNGNGNEVDRKLRSLQQRLGINDETINVEKNKEIIVECIEKNIFPLLNKVYIKISEHSLFKNRNVDVIIYSENGNVGSFSISHLITLINTDYNNKYKTINELVFRYNFNNIRNYNKGSVSIIIYIRILFHQLVYEIRTDDNRVTIDKLYHENITLDESESIIQAISLSLLEKTEAAMKE
jgi:MinD-like ATPase involved in chromosome partitioning or flagellar assembly